MNKEINELINQPWLKYFNKIQLPQLIEQSIKISELISDMGKIKSIIKSYDFSHLPKINQRTIDKLITKNHTLSFEYLESIKMFSEKVTFINDRLFNLKNLPSFDYLLNNLNRYSNDIDYFNELSFSEVESDINKEISSVNDFNLLSEKAKKFITFILFSIWSIFLGTCNSIIDRTLFDTAEKQIILTKHDLKEYTKSISYNDTRYILKSFNYRFTTANSLNIRAKPNLKSEIITSLPIGTLVQVINGSSKSWLEVTTRVDNEIKKGWILRRYTTYIK